jgi:trimeric autotransporter adhesin
MHSYVEQDLDGDGVSDLITYYDTWINADGSTEKQVNNYAGADLNVFIGGQTTLTSSDGLRIDDFRDYNGDGKLDIETYTETVLNANGSTTNYVTHYAYDNFANDDTITTVSADKKTTTITVDPFGEGKTQLQKTIVVQADGSLLTTIIYPNVTDPIFSTETDTRTHSANGLSNSIYIKSGSIDYMHVTDVTTLNSDGSRTRPTPTSTAGAVSTRSRRSAPTG